MDSVIASVDAVHATYRSDMAKLQMRVVLYRRLLEEHGIEIPDHDDDELMQMWQDCRAVISTAATFTSHLRSAKELLA